MAVVNPYQTELPVVEFSNALDMLLAQEGSSLRAFVTSKTGYRGRVAQAVNYIAPMRFQAAGARGARLEPQYASYQTRWVSPANHEFVVQTDNFDDLLGFVDPHSAIIRVMEDAAGVLFDDVIIPAFFSTATIGPESAQTTETFNSGSNFPVAVVVAEDFGAGADTGMTIAKIIEAKRILSKYENNLDRMKLHLGMTSQAEADLMKSAEFTSTDYRSHAVLDDVGRTKFFMGCEFHYSERWGFNPSDSGERYLPMWTQDGMHLGIWADVEPNISKETGIVSQPWQLYAKVTLGATRLQAGKVVRISVSDDTGGSVTI